jgi:hypothetical protein
MNIVDKIVKIESTITIQIVDNGYVFEVGGKDANDEWKNVKIVCTTRSELDSLLDEALELDRVDN